MLREIKNTRQISNEPKRRWFNSANLDLIIWLDEKNQIQGFQLCYDKLRKEKAFTYKQQTGFNHQSVDNGESNYGNYKQSPILLAEQQINVPHLCQIFIQQSVDIENIIVEYIINSIDDYGRYTLI